MILSPAVVRSCKLFMVSALSVVAATAQVELHLPEAQKLIAPDAVIERLATDMQFVEGPVWLSGERALVFSDIPAGKLLRWTQEGGVAVWRDSEHSNGNTLDREGRLLSCQHGARNLVRYEPDGAVTVLAERHGEGRLNSPNDVVVRKDGTIWFTDPTYGLAGREREQPGNYVYRLDPRTGTTTVVQREFDQPNGLCFAPGHDRLYIADSGKGRRVGAFAVDERGALSAPLFWLAGGSDGMRCDARGNVYTTSRDGVRIYAASGLHLATVRLPEAPANCAFGGAAFDQLFVTARTSLYRVQLKVAGAAGPGAKTAGATGK